MNITDENAWIFYILSNIVGAAFLLVCHKSPRAGRWLFFALFAWACTINWILAVNSPHVYLDYAKHAVPAYAHFIRGTFADHTTTFVGAIATGQGLIALGMLASGWVVKGAAIGSIVFLLAIAPLGMYAAFPFSLTVSWAAWLIYREASPTALMSLQSVRHRQGGV